MHRVIELTVSPQGETTVQTRGFVGGTCLHASRWLEEALGAVTREQRTAEFYAAGTAEQHVRQQ